MYQSNKSEKEEGIGTALLFVKLFLHKKAFHAVKNYLVYKNHQENNNKHF